MTGFSNQSIIGPNPNKPHIVKRFGRWRVSPMPQKRTLEASALWRRAHAWVNAQNTRIVFEQFQRDMKEVKFIVPKWD